ncbi:MAG TPA: hypothetical protein DD417_08595 [Elusimicrobia bacterium]|nr:hypothetical protein [Elusimicrobiota bacterium]
MDESEFIVVRLRRGRLTHILNLLDLAPSIRERIMALPPVVGQGPITERSVRLLAPGRKALDFLYRKYYTDNAMKKPIHSALGSTHPVGGTQITLFIPGKDRSGKPMDQDHWAGDALDTLGRLFRGATAFPPGRGVWRDDTRGGALLREVTVMVVSYVPKAEIRKRLPELRAFLHRFGREADQGEVGLIVDGNYYGISEYDAA